MSRVQFLDRLSQHLDQQGEITLLNFYKGVPVEAPARPVSVAEDHLLLEVEPPFSICLTWEDETWLLLQGTDTVGKAVIESFDLPTGRAALGKFRPEDPFFYRRSATRVEPRSNIEVAVENINHRVIEYLADITTQGVGIRIPALESGQVFQNGEAVKITIRLPQGKTVIPGVIQNLTRGKDFYRMGVVFDQEQDSDSAVSSYITHRKEAIFQTLKIRYELEIEKQQRTAR